MRCERTHHYTVRLIQLWQTPKPIIQTRHITPRNHCYDTHIIQPVSEFGYFQAVVTDGMVGCGCPEADYGSREETYKG